MMRKCSYLLFWLQAVLKNAKDRRENNLLEPDFFDSQMLWVMLRHLRADRRRRVSLCSLVNFDYIVDIQYDTYVYAKNIIYTNNNL